MRIVQLIDSLEIGGAEKMAVNYANALAKRIAFSGLAVTRKEGDLKSQLQDDVNYIFLNRNKTIDFSAIVRLRSYCKQNRIDYLQPHSTSFFIAVLVKLIYPKVKIIWLDHYGLSEFLNTRKSLALKTASLFFKGIIVVNDQLKKWAESQLHCKKVIYLANFTPFNDQEKPETVLLGEKGKRILCLANLRFQKNHFLLLEVAERVRKSHPDWTFHLVGKDFKDEYATKVKEVIKEKGLENTVYSYGSKKDTQHIIADCTIAVLTSQSEGLPVALLEYGWGQKPVVSTDVGEIAKVIRDERNGLIVANYDTDAFYKAVVSLMENETLRSTFGAALYQTIQEQHSEPAVMDHFLDWVRKL